MRSCADSRFLDAPECAEYVAGGIDLWCATPRPPSLDPSFCCGVCSKASIAGSGQLVWQLVYTILACSVFILRLQDGWWPMVFQMVFSDAMIISLAIRLTGYTDMSDSEWTAEFLLVTAFQCLPVITAALMAPSSAQLGLDSQLFREARAAIAINDRSSSLSADEKAIRMRDFIRQRATRHKRVSHRWLSFTAAWLMLHLVLFAALYGAIIWPAAGAASTLFAQSECVPFVAEVEGRLSTRVAALALLCLATALDALLWIGCISYARAASLLARRNRVVASPAHVEWDDNDEATLAKFLHAKPGKTNRGAMVPQILAVLLIFTIWAGITLHIWRRALNTFLLSGEDPLTLGQLELWSLAVPVLVALYSAVDSRL